MASSEQATQFLEAMALIEELVDSVEKLDKAQYLNDLQRFVVQKGREYGLESIYAS